MTTSAQARQKIADVVNKRSRVDQDLSACEQKKATKEAEAADKASRAAKATSPSTARMYARQAEQARAVAVAEGKKIAALAKKRADLSKQEAQHNKTLTNALKSEAATDKREADKAHRARQQEDRKREAQRKADERARQQEQIRAEQRQRAAEAATATHIAQTEERLTAQINALRPPQQENLRILYATATPEGDLRVSQEIRRVKNAVVAALHRDLVDIEHAPDVTADDLLNYLTSFQPHVVHFSGHASEDVLVFDDGSLEGGQGRTIPIDLFMRAVTAPDHQPALVVLNACQSATNLETFLSPLPTHHPLTHSWLF